MMLHDVVGITEDFIFFKATAVQTVAINRGGPVEKELLKETIDEIENEHDEKITNVS